MRKLGVRNSKKVEKKKKRRGRWRLMRKESWI